MEEKRGKREQSGATAVVAGVASENAISLRWPMARGILCFVRVA